MEYMLRSNNIKYFIAEFLINIPYSNTKNLFLSYVVIPLMLKFNFYLISFSNLFYLF